MAKRRRDVVKQLSNLSIDEVSLVDRGANQHALVSITKRAPEAEDAFEPIEKYEGASGGVSPLLAGYLHRESKTGVKHSGLKTAGGSVLGSTVGANVGAAVGGAVGGEKGMIAGSALGAVGGGAAGAHHVVHNHYYGEAKKNLDKTEFGKALDAMDIDSLFDVSKKGGSSFGQGGQQAKIDTFSGDDPAGVLDQEGNHDVGPDGNVSSGTEKTKGEDTPPQKSKKKGGSSEINPSKLSGLGKSADFWTQIIEKALDDEDSVTKHFPGGGAQNPMGSPFPGAQGMGQAPMMQTPGVQPMGMGQPTPPPGQATGGMPQQLPPDVIAYIQQLEQALQEAQGGDPDSDGDNDNSSDNSDSDSSNKNPFGKSGDFGMDTNDLFLAELAKSLDAEDNRELIGKAYEAVSKAEERAKAAEEIAKQERDLRLEREFIAKAAEFDVPVPAKELGPVLKRLAESVSKEDFQTVVKCLQASTEQNALFQEFGKRGGGSNGSILDEVEQRALSLASGDGVSKALTPEQAVAQVFDMDPAAYDRYNAERRQALR